MQGSVLFGQYIYLFGGYYKGILNYHPKKECFRFNTENLSWTLIADLPVVSGCNSAVKVGKDIIVSGF